LRNFKKDEVGVINVLGKPLPFKSELKSYTTDNYQAVRQALANSKAKSIVIDDSGYLMTNEFMRGHGSTGAGNAIFAFYNELANKFWNLIRFVAENLPEDKIVYFVMHEEKNDFGDIKPKTIGKMLDEKVYVEGMFAIAIRAIITEGKYQFKTKSDGLDVCKTPMGMFDEQFIDNDLKLVDGAIREFYNIKEEVKNDKAS